MYTCLGLFALANAAYTYRIWRPKRISPNRLKLTEQEKEGRFGCVVYTISCLGNVLMACECAYMRFQTHSAPLVTEDWVTFGTLAVITAFTGLALASSDATNEEKNRVALFITIMSVAIPQGVGAYSIWHLGHAGISFSALLFGLGIIVSRLYYFAFLAANSVGDKRIKAVSILYTESANGITWMAMIAAYYYA